MKEYRRLYRRNNADRFKPFPEKTYCRLCGCTISLHGLEIHKGSKKHQRLLRKKISSS